MTEEKQHKPGDQLRELYPFFQEFGLHGFIEKVLEPMHDAPDMPQILDAVILAAKATNARDTAQKALDEWGQAKVLVRDLVGLSLDEPTITHLLGIFEGVMAVIKLAQVGDFAAEVRLQERTDGEPT